MLCRAADRRNTDPKLPNQISTAQTLDGIDKQIAKNQIDLSVAVAANKQAGSTEQHQGVVAVNCKLSFASKFLSVLRKC